MDNKAKTIRELAHCFGDLAAIILFTPAYKNHDCRARARYAHCVGKEHAYLCIARALEVSDPAKRETAYVMWYDCTMTFAEQYSPKMRESFMKAFASVNPTQFGLGQSAEA